MFKCCKIEYLKNVESYKKFSNIFCWKSLSANFALSLVDNNHSLQKLLTNNILFINKLISQNPLGLKICGLLQNVGPIRFLLCTKFHPIIIIFFSKIPSKHSFLKPLSDFTGFTNPSRFAPKL